MQANDLLGHSGIVTSTVESTVSGWNGIPVDGISADIGDAQEPMVLVTPTNTGGVRVREGGRTDSVGVRLTKKPTANVVVTIQAPAINLASSSRVRGVEIRTAGGAWGQTVTLTFTSANYFTAQVVEVRAIDDAASEDTRTVVLQTAVSDSSAATEYRGSQVANTLVTVEDDDAVGVVVGGSGGGGIDLGGPAVVEPYYNVSGTLVSSTGSTFTYRITLNRLPLSDVTITINPGSQLTVDKATLTFGPGTSLTQLVTLTAIGKDGVEGPHFGYVGASITIGETWSGTGLQLTGKKNEISVSLASFSAAVQGRLATTNALRGYTVRIFQGTGEGQYRRVSESYLSGGRLVMAMETGWDIQPGTAASWVLTGYAAPATVGALAGTVSSVTTDRRTITLTGVTLPTADGGLVGAIVRITDGSGPGQYRRIAWNTATTITTVDSWGTGTIATGTQVAILGIFGTDVDRLSVAIADADTPGVVVTQSDGSTRVVEGTSSTDNTGQVTDSYTVRLTRAPGGKVRVYLDPQVTDTAYYDSVSKTFRHNNAVQVSLSGAVWDGTLGRWYVEFTDADWNLAKTITVIAIADGIRDGNDLQAFAPVARLAGLVQGPLFVFGGQDPDPAYNTSLDGYLPLVLPGETATGPKPPVLPTIRVDETKQVDRLIVHNQDSPAADHGHADLDPHHRPRHG